MANTGLLILSNPAKVKKLLPVIKRHVLKTLYIQYSPEKKLVPQYQWKQPIFSNIITSIYTLAASVLARVDVRVLISKSQKNPTTIATKRPIEVVIFDKNFSRDDAQLFINNFLKNRSNSCDFITLDVETLVTEDENIHDIKQVCYDNVVLGGTFDRLHNGHKILLSEALLRCNKNLTVGVTDESMIKSKILWELIEPCSKRIQVLEDFLQDIDSSVNYTIVPISDIYGPTKTDANLNMIVVSEETKRGGNKVNELRKENGLKLLDICVVNLAEDSGHCDHEDAKISSSNQRMRLLGTRLQEPDLTGKSLKPYIIGLTGGIASGKSSIANKLQSLGAGVVHCDALAHDLYEPNQKCFDTVVRLFGQGILTAEGRINRKALADIVFKNEGELEKLNRVVWPEILELALEKIKKLHDQGYEIVVMEAAVLIQAKWQSVCHEIWTCIIPHDEAVKRMIERNGLTKEEAEARIRVQPSNMEQVNAATVVLSTLWSHQMSLLTGKVKDNAIFGLQFSLIDEIIVEFFELFYVFR